jgi:hypothetical protein
VRNEQVLDEVVRAWAEREFPGDQDASARVSAIALDSYVAGASVSEACRQAGAFMDGWARHPSHWMSDPQPAVRLAS